MRISGYQTVPRVMRDPSSESGGRCVGRIFDRRGWNLSHLSDPLGGSLFGFEQLLHGHGLVEMVFGLGDLFTGDQEPHVGVHQVFRSSATSRVELCQSELRGGQACSAAFSQMASVALSWRARHWGDSQTDIRPAMCGSAMAQRHKRQLDTAGLITSVAGADAAGF